MRRDFSSNSTQSMVLFPDAIQGSNLYKGVPLPHNYGKFSQSAMDLYISGYQQAQLLGCTPRKCHTSAMDLVRRTHILREGKYILPDPVW